jgi:hypothetical protein
MKQVKRILTVNLGTDFILLKFVLFLIISVFGITSMLVLNKFDLFFVILLVTTIWSCSRIYYFLFYVIHKFFDPQYKFSGLFHFISYFINRHKKKLYGASIEEASIAAPYNFFLCLLIKYEIKWNNPLNLYWGSKNLWIT